MWFDAQQGARGNRAGRPAPCYICYTRYKPHRALAPVAIVADVAGPRPVRSETQPDQDAAALLALLEREGPQTYGAAAVILGIGATRAWRAEAELRRAGRIRLGPLGRAFIIEQAE